VGLGFFTRVAREQFLPGECSAFSLLIGHSFPVIARVISLLISATTIVKIPVDPAEAKAKKTADQINLDEAATRAIIDEQLRDVALGS
jgi:hypothetical protein